jgi:hypothetical protein
MCACKFQNTKNLTFLKFILCMSTVSKIECVDIQMCTGKMEFDY